MATATYEAIKTYTFSSVITGFTWTSIPSTYTDLVLVARIKNTTGNNYEAYVTYNNDNGNNYAFGFVQNYAGNLQAGQNLNIAQIRPFKSGATYWSGHVQNILGYANNQTYTNSIGRGGFVDNNNTTLSVGLWLNTAVINRIDINMESGASFEIGSRFDLYGIKAE